MTNTKNYSFQLSNSVKKCFNYLFYSKINSDKNLNKTKDIHPNCYNDLSYFPSTVFWKITSNCNLRCKHCFYADYRYKFEDKNDLTTEELLELAEFFVEEINVTDFIITGGEPLLKQGVESLLKYLKSKNVRIRLLTNATLITEENISDLGSVLNNETDSVLVSLDGACPFTNDSIRGEGSFNKTISGIKYLIKNNINVTLCYTATSINLDDIPKLYDLCSDLKIKNLNIGRFEACSKKQEYLIPKFDKVFISIAELIEKIKNPNSLNLELMIFKVYDFLDFEIGKDLLDKYLSSCEELTCQNLMCHEHKKITISGDGKIYLCLATENNELCLGDLKEQSFFEIWEQRFNNIFFQSRELEMSVCKFCKYVSLCHAGCPAKAYYEYGRINAPDGDCSYGKILMKEHYNKVL